MWKDLKRFFSGRTTPPPEKAPPPPPKTAADFPTLSWVPAAENPFGVEILDLRPFSQSFISASSDPANAANAVSWRGDDGLSFVGTAPEHPAHIACELSYAAPEGSLDGRWFCPQVMEEKWALYHYQDRLYGIRSWTRMLSFVAHTRRRDGELIITGVDVSAPEGKLPMSDEDIARHIDFLIKSHVLEAKLPAPILAGLTRDPQVIALYCFSSYGRRALAATFADLRAQRVEKPIRADLPLSIALDGHDRARAAARLAEAPTAELSAHSRYHGYTPLHAAAICGYLEIVDGLLARGVDVNRRNDLGRSPLHDAASFDKVDPKVIARLIAAGADVGARDREEATPLHLCAQTGTLEVLRLLLAAGADPDAATARGFTGLHQSAEAGREEVVRALLDAGADPNHVAGKWTVIGLARATERTAIVELLQARGARG
jgi:ankyrin repeat protein